MWPMHGRAEETNGKYAVMEATIRSGGGPPPHIHGRDEKGSYVSDAADFGRPRQSGSDVFRVRRPARRESDD